ncbi:MAG: T9SS type A sorting domain-containing protein [Panacibacter sp.]
MKQMKQNTTTGKLLSCIIIPALFFFTAIKAQPGTIDSSFGINGKVINELFGRVRCTALQKDGKILAAGLAYEETIILMRYNIDGTLDNTFGVSGKVLTDLVPKYHIYYSQAMALAVQKDGKIVITGHGYRDVGLYGDYDILIARYNPDGSLDESFGKSGIVISDFGDPDEQANTIALQPNGKIVVGGTSNNDQLLARYNINGGLDSTFAGKGWLTTDYFGFDYVNSIALQPNGKIVAGGTSGVGDQFFLLIRYNRNGTIDSSFGSYGKVATDFGYGGDQLSSMALQPDDKIIGTGKTGGAPGLEGKIAVIRYLTNGNLDSSFGTNGKVKTEVASKFSNGAKILLQPNAKIVVVGGVYNLMSSYDWDFALLRYNKDGSVNKPFGNHGLQTTHIVGWDYATSALLQPDGKIVAAGLFGDYGSVLVRYNGKDPVNVRINQWSYHKGFTLDSFPGLKNAGNIAVERSANGTVFNRIAEMPAHINNQPYSFEDGAPLNGTGYYRVSGSKEDGSIAYSNVIAISDNTTIKLFPNPVRNTLGIEGLSTSQKSRLSIIDIIGNKRATATVTGRSYSWNITQLKPGNYILRIENDNAVTTKMFTKG